MLSPVLTLLSLRYYPPFIFVAFYVVRAVAAQCAQRTRRRQPHSYTLLESFAKLGEAHLSEGGEL